MNKWIGLLLIACLLTGLASGCGFDSGSTGHPAGSGQIDPEGKVVTILTGGTSGVYFHLGYALAKVYGEKLGLRASAQTTMASVENTLKIGRKQAEIGFAMADTVGDAYRGRDVFADAGPLTNLSATASLYPNYLHVITTRKSGIQTLQDLKGKRVAVGSIGSGTEIMVKRVLEQSGLTYDDVQAVFLSFAEVLEGIRNGTVDAAFLSSGYPNTGIMELAAANEIRLLPIPKGLVEQLHVKYPDYVYAKIPANTYKGVTVDIETASVHNLLVTHQARGEDEVYEWTKTMFENMGRLYEAHSSAKQIKLETAAVGLPIPLHPGAKRYYQEKHVLP